ncbi:MAG: metallophosphoesterase [Candidatus Riflebacteria bacterium]|nr:metallophosphoesterase [Candidatus Riflebacteria bacterium]
MTSIRTVLRYSLTALLILAIYLPGAVFARDWTKDPPWVEVPGAQRVAAIGDIHGAFTEFSDSLRCLGMAERKSADGFELLWTGGKGVLVFTGDFTDRGKYSKEVYDAVMSLEKQADAAGGRVIALMGNHEILLLNGTVEKWANTLSSDKKQLYINTIESFTRGGCDFHQAISPQGTYGAWIRRRPLFAIVNGFFFIHGGLAVNNPTRSAIAADFRDAIDAEKLDSGILMDEKGPLWIRDWWDDSTQVDARLQALGASGVVFGHTPGAMGIKGNINAKDNRLVGIDIGMTPAYGYSKGGGLLITTEQPGKLVFKAVYPDRPETILFRTTASVSAP